MLFCVRLMNFIQTRPLAAEIWRRIDFSRWRTRPLNTSSGFVFVDVTAFRRPKFITKFRRHISIDCWLPLFKNKCPPYWKSTFCFDFDHLPEIGTLFCIRLPNFVQIEAPAAEIWRYIHCSRWRPQRLNTTSGFVSVDVTAFRRSKSISKPNFIEISQMAAEI